MSFTPSHSESPIFPAGLVVDQSARDSEQMKELAVFWRMQQEQLEPGRYQGRIIGVHTERIQLGRTWRSLSTRVGGRAPSGTLVVGVLQPSLRPRYFRLARLARRELAVIWPGEEFVFQPMGPSCVFTVAVSAEFAEKWVEQKWGEPLSARCVDGRLAVAESTSVGSIARQLAAILKRAMADREMMIDPQRATRLEESVLETVFGCIDLASPSYARSRRRKLAFLAKSHLLEHAHEPLSMTELCRTTGYSPRNLEVVFHEAFGMSLKARLQAMRLNGARRDLLTATGSDQSVKEIALRWGFMHLGRFSVTYRKWFGEKPSATLGRQQPARSGDSPRLHQAAATRQRS